MTGNERKAALYALIIELDRLGIRSTTLLAKVIGISDEYARIIRIQLGLHRPGPRTLADAMAIMSDDVIGRVREIRNALLEKPNESS